MSTLDGVLPGPLPGGGLVAGAVGLVDMCDLGYERVVGVGVCEHGANGEEDCECVSMLGVDKSIMVAKMEGAWKMHGRCTSTHGRRLCVPFEMVSAGLHWSLKMSKQMEPLLLMLGW